MENLAQDFLNYYKENKNDYPLKNMRLSKDISDLTGNLELDGYVYRNNILLAPESDVLDTTEESGVLESLFKILGLDNEEIIFNHLELSEKHYLDGNWGDSISNSRNFLEGIMREVAATYSKNIKGVKLSKKKYESPGSIRNYLKDERLLESKETKVIAAVYHLLSHTGGHPYMAENDEARLLRHLALTLSQFVMIRLEGRLKAI